MYVMEKFKNMYKDVSPPSLSGASDVIVIESKDGRMRSTPFHVRFGKIGIFRSEERSATMTVNGTIVNATMIFDANGSLFFVDESEEEQDLELSKCVDCPEEDDDTPLRKRLCNCVEEDKKRVEEAERKIRAKTLEISLNYRKCGEFVDSRENYEHLYRHRTQLLHFIKEGAISFSECRWKRIGEGIETTFKTHEERYFNRNKDTVVGVGKSSRGTPVFYLGFLFFSEIYFSTKEESVEINRRIAKIIIERKIGEKMGWFWSAPSTENPEAERLIERESTEEPDEELVEKSPNMSKKKRIGLKSKIMNSNLLKELNLKYGENDVIYKVKGLSLKATIFKWRWNDKIVISDVDGTVTKSDVIGYLCGVVGWDWTQDGIADLYRKIDQNGYKMVYLSSRPIGHASFTRDYLRSINQDGAKLPVGPVLLYPGRIASALYKEMVIKTPEQFKVSALNEIRRLFSDEKEESRINPFFAGFGNKENDLLAYSSVGIPFSKIFIVDKTGGISTGISTFLKLSYKSICGIADLMFPSKKDFELDDAFTGTRYWKTDNISTEMGR